VIGITLYCEFGVEISVWFGLHDVVHLSWLKSGDSEHDERRV